MVIRHQVDKTTVQPVYYTVRSDYVVNDSVTLYPLFTDRKEGIGTSGVSLGYVAGNLSNSFLKDISSTISDDTITELDERALILTVGGSKDAWTLSSESGQLLGAADVKKYSGTTTWTVSIFNGNATIQNSNSSF